MLVAMLPLSDDIIGLNIWHYSLEGSRLLYTMCHHIYTIDYVVPNSAIRVYPRAPTIRHPQSTRRSSWQSCSSLPYFVREQALTHSFRRGGVLQ